MLKELYIKNFVLIEELQMDFEKGFSAFIGETGAGKSILMDAISLVCGARGSSDVIRSGTEKTTIEATFDLNDEAKSILEEFGLESDDDVLVLTRELSVDGKSVARVNHRSVSLSILKTLGSLYVDIHSQFDTASMKINGSYLHMLDNYMGDVNELTSYHNAYKEYIDVVKEKEEYLSTSLSNDELDIIQYNLQEITDADIYENELEELEEKKKLLESSEAIERAGNEFIELSDGDSGISEKLYEATRILRSVKNIEAFEKASETLDSYYYELKDVVSDINQLISSISNDAENYEALNERTFEIRKLFRKYGGSYDSMMRQKAVFEEQIAKYSDSQSYEADLFRREKECFKKASDAANALHEKRMETAKTMETKLLSELKDLELKNASFRIECASKDLSSDGIDDVTFMVSMNKGEVLRPLLKCASGGELSRFMLGLQVVCKDSEVNNTLIFDEIDSGISGKTAYSIGKKMRELAANAQVFSVTHLAQVAAGADQVYFISKETKNNLTTSRIELLNDETVYEKLAIIANGKISEASIATAKEMVKEAKEL